MRGEHYESFSAFIATQGSSPHARGTHFTHFRVLSDLGIIPACAGNTS
ncbi:hypothetical protein BBOU_0616 [Bifidobacterium boum]|uniref:Uncharacterized protein n=1 Tax=Bifidobacterium boum TaxID=78343 RepID=A0A086ZPN7_9BIFI|nr:hypothetical protein BBOU_0616 [Bifidobacterium boum]